MNDCSVLFFSVNLMTSMGSMTAIVKQRPQYLIRVVQGFETLHGKCCIFIRLLFCQSFLIENGHCGSFLRGIHDSKFILFLVSI